MLIRGAALVKIYNTTKVLAALVVADKKISEAVFVSHKSSLKTPTYKHCTSNIFDRDKLGLLIYADSLEPNQAK